MTSKQADQILADIANGKDIRTSSGAKVTAENFEKFFLNDMIRKLGTKSEGETTVLYSSANEAAEIATKSPNIRIINKTEAFEFLMEIDKNENFSEAWEKLYGYAPNTKNYTSREGILLGGLDSEYDKSDKLVKPKTEGAWDIVSRNFVQTAKGETVIILGDDAKMQRVFFRTELPELLKNKNITKINGMNKAEFTSKLNSYATDKEKLNFIISDRKTVLEITGKSELYELNQKDFETARKNIKYNEILHAKTKDLISHQNQKVSGNTEHTIGNKKPTDAPIEIGDNEKKIDKITREIVNNEKMSYSDKIKEITKVLKNEPPAKVIGTLNKIGTAGLVLSAGWVSYEAYKALEEGDAQRASDLIGEYSVSLGGGYLTAAAAMALMGGTVTVGSLLIGMAAMAAGSKLFSYLYENRDALLYFIDPFDENWKGRDQEWLEEFKNFWQDPNRWENAKDTLPYLVEQFNHTLRNAINSIGQFLGSIFNFLIYDPLALDLNGDGKIGINPISITASDKKSGSNNNESGGAYFDHNGDGVSHRSSWISKEDGILAYDRNGNGKIDDGGELLENLVA